MRRAAALGADLHDAYAFAGRGEHDLAFNDIDTDRLLDINIGAGLDGGNHGQGVPMVGRGNEHHVEILFLQHFPVIAVDARLLFRSLACRDHFGGIAQHVFVHVAKRNHFHRSDLDEAK